MKTHTLFLFLLAACPCYAQSDLEYKTYELTGDIVLPECDHTGAPLAVPTSKFCSAKWRFSVVGQKDADTFIITFFDWYSLDELVAGQEGKSLFKKDGAGPLDPALKRLTELYNYDLSRPAGLEDRFFLITKYQLEKAAAPLTSRFAPVFGAMVLPFKYRPQTGLVTKDLGIGAIGGAQVRTSKRSSYSLMFGAIISSITVDSMSTEGNVQEPSERSALSIPVGLLFQWETLQIGLLAGWDLMLDGNKDKWCYQGKPWLTLGVGVALFTNGGSASDKVQR